MSIRVGSPLPEIPELSGVSSDIKSDGGGVVEDTKNNNSLQCGDVGDYEHQIFRFENRIRRWHVTFGNPALGTYAGSIVTIHDRSRRRQRHLLGDDHYESDVDDDESDSDDSSESSRDSFSSCSSIESSSDIDEKITQRIVVMTEVPPHQVPDGVLNLVRSHRPFIQQVRIVIGSSRLEEAKYRQRRREIKERKAKYLNNDENQAGTMRRSRSQTWAHEHDNNLDGSNLITSMSEVSISKLVDSNLTTSMSEVSINKLDRGRSISLDNTNIIDNTTGFEDEKCSLDDYNEEEIKCFPANDHQSESEDKNYHIIFVLDSEESANVFVSDLHDRPYTSLDDTEICSVYNARHLNGEDGVSLLGPFFASKANEKSIAASAKDDQQCPVCLDSLASTSDDKSSSILTTVCNHSFHIDCLARWAESPCPVCRYDHSGLNQTLSKCHVCATTVRNYVCLICGVISCSNGPSSSFMQCPSAADDADQAPQAPSHLGHALQHYEETLHAYALDTETQHVWDFAGGGYVHRLLSSENGKIVEGTDPQLMNEERGLNLLNGGNTGEGQSLPLTAMERSTIPTYSSPAEDDEAIHRKLEGFAGQYYTLLKSQLEQQRNFYQGKLEAIRREYETTRSEHVSTADLVSALKQERNHLEQRCMTLRKKHRKVQDDAAFLENMNESLEADKYEFRKHIAEAQSELAEAKELTQQLLTPLEEKVSQLMLQLERGFGSGNDLDERKPSST